MEGYKTLDQALEDAPSAVEFTCDRHSFSLRNGAIRITINTSGCPDRMYLGFGHVSPNVIYRGSVKLPELRTDGILCQGVGIGDMNSFLGDIGGFPEEGNGVYLTHNDLLSRKDWYPIGSEEAAEFLRRLPTALLRRDATNQKLGTELLRRAAVKYDVRKWYDKSRDLECKEQEERGTFSFLQWIRQGRAIPE